MEESSEAHMETNVTSTTQDVPDTQEVTGSNGHVEMVIVVEKLEDEDNISSSAQKQHSLTINDSPIKVYKPKEKVPQVVTQAETTSKVSPTEDLKEIIPEIVKRTEKMPETPIKAGIKSPQKLIKVETVSNNLGIQNIVEKSPQKHIQQGLLSKKSPIKDICEVSLPQKVTQINILSQQSPMKNISKISSQKLTELKVTRIKSPFEDVSEKSPQVIQTQVLNRCATKDEDVWPQTVTQKEVPPKKPTLENVNEKSSQIFTKEVEKKSLFRDDDKSPKVVNEIEDYNGKKSVQKAIEPEITKAASEKEDNDIHFSSKQCDLVEEIVSKEQLDNETVESVQIKETNETVISLTEFEKPEITQSVEQSPKKLQQNTIDSPVKDAPVPVNMLPTEELILSDSKLAIETKKKSQVENMVNGKVSCENSNDSMNVSSIMPMDISVERENSSDSQLEVNSVSTNSSDISEKEHNKSISRELKSLIKSAKESKIISECTQLTTKRRKSPNNRNSSINLNSSTEADKIQGVRRTSINSQKSNSSEKNEKIPVKRSMRSQNPEFVNKVKQFLSSVTGKYHKDSGDDDDDEVEIRAKVKRGNKDKSEQNDSILTPGPPRIKNIDVSSPEKRGKLLTDLYCWRCHWALEQTNNEKTHNPLYCTVCPRSYHYKCLTGIEKTKIVAEKSWVCPECITILQAECSETRSPSMKKVSSSMLCDLLKYALERMMDLNGVEPFMQPVDRTAFPDYDKYVVHPMDLSQLRNNITEGLYGSTEAFLADANWILHNSIIFNTLYPTVQSKLTAGARALVRSCRTEMGEIEACPECYAAAHARKPTWFTDVCTTPHILLWAKLKGFPYWPAKGMSVSATGLVDVRFFGAHDRAWVHAKDCFLYSEKDPNNFRTKRQDIIDSMKEAEEHIRNISRRYGKFVYPPFKTQLDTTKITEQIKMMIPTFEGELRTLVKEKSNSSFMPAKKKRRSHSAKSSTDMSETDIEQSTPVSARKMADGAEIARDDDEANEKSDDMEIIVVTREEESDFEVKSTELSQDSRVNSRKRRHSELEEAVITIMESSNNPSDAKRKKSISKQDKEKKKLNDQDASSSKESGNKSENIPKAKDISIMEVKKDETTVKDKDTSSINKTDTEKDKNLRVTPIRIAFIQKDKQHNLRTSTAKEAMAKIVTPTRVNDVTSPRHKTYRSEKTDKEKSSEKAKENLKKSEKRRNSRSSRSLNNTPTDKTKSIFNDKKTDKAVESSSREKVNTQNSKEKIKSNNNVVKETEVENIVKEKQNSKSVIEIPEETTSVQECMNIDDDTTLAVIARESRELSDDTSHLPTITSIRSLSTTAHNTKASSTKTKTNSNTTELIIDATSISCTSTHTIADSNDNDKESAAKLQRLRNNNESMVGRVGVRAFARMTSPEKSPQKNDQVQVEIKAEPIDVDDADRQIEKLNLMNAFRLRPVNPQPPVSKFNEKHLNKVVVTPVCAKKTVTKPVEIKTKAKKSFPQSKKSEDGQLNSKNSMVYIPIQPPMTQAPIRPPKMVAGSTCPPNSSKTMIVTSTVANTLVNTITTPKMTLSSVSPSSSLTVNTVSQAAMPAITPVPAAVHTVPLMTSVNGQWMFSLQPVMSVGTLDNAQVPPILNGVADRNTLPNVQNIPTIHNIPSVPAPGAQVPAPGVQAPAPGVQVPAVIPPVSRPPTDASSPGDLPRLLQRPSNILQNPLDINTPIGALPTPSTAGPLTAKLNQSAVKLADFFRTLLEDSLDKLDAPASHVTAIKLQLEQAKWNHQTEIQELKHNHELTIAEMRSLFEKEKIRVVAEARRASQIELEAAVKATKAKQWCANCNQEAQFYCCWNTSYCDYPCQRAHWAQHFNVCTQQRQDGSSNGEPPSLPDNRLQSQPDNMPKNTSVPALTVGGKLAPSRIYTQEQSNTNTQKSAIIMSMMEDKSGNQTMKCVGTYKSNSPTQNVPVVINKQIMSKEENTNKKVVSSGGYLIVGGNSNTPSVSTPARRGHAIYYT